ncbi:MAG: ADP-ribosylation factor-like protein [Candidatus Hodarchaeota archaeon]
MLRQIHIFHNNKHIFNYSYALAFRDEDLTIVQKTIQPYIDMPIPNKTFQRPTSDYQLFYRSTENMLFLFVTDLVDSLDYVDTIIKKTMNEFKELFPDPETFGQSQLEKEEYMKSLENIQHELHSKIAIIGPINAGKTQLFNLLKSDGEKPIMNFALSSQYKIDNLSFDVWDFQLKDNFSLLWSKFIKGSDLVILLFDLSNYHLKVINHFLNLQKQENNLSKLIIIGNKRDLVSDEDIKLIKNELNITDFEELSLIDPNAKEKLNQIISNILELRKPLPENFESLKKEAEELYAEGNLVLAISKYKELIKICNAYQDFTYINSFKQQLEELQRKINEQNKLRKIEESRKKFQVPDRIRFTKKIEVKPLPQDIGLDQSKVKLEIPKITPEEKIPTEKTEDLLLFKKEEKMDESIKTTLQPSDIKVDLGVVVPHAKRPAAPEKLVEREFSQELQRLIEKKGSSLSLKLCDQLISELQKTLARPLKIEDIEMAADIFVKQERL